VSSENPHILELRRRVQTDPASIAFAQLAEEYRRNGANEEAVGICRAGLAYHPDYLSARVTLGRALVELGRLDEAHTELTRVLTLAPDNLAANRAIAEMYRLRGQLSEALLHYRRALDLAKHDPDLEHQVERIENVVSPPSTPPAATQSTSIAIEELFDFDRLLEQLGGGTIKSEPTPPAPTAPSIAVTPSPFDTVELVEDDGDPFSRLERQLRDSEERRDYEEVVASAPDERAIDQRVMAELEAWLSAIVIDREQPPSA
jgi:tetratricopeptide (TPR) repeat protein